MEKTGYGLLWNDGQLFESTSSFPVNLKNDVKQKMTL